MKFVLLVSALLLLASSLADLLNASGPSGPNGPDIVISGSGILIQGVSFIGTLEAGVAASIVTVLALLIDVFEYAREDDESPAIGQAKD